jgi:hypothetical protein
MRWLSIDDLKNGKAFMNHLVLNSVLFGYWQSLTLTLMQLTTALALTLRVLISLSTQSFFQPDEYFQSLGYLTWEWLAPNPIRSILYPLINVPMFWLLRTIGLDQTSLLVCLEKTTCFINCSNGTLLICRSMVPRLYMAFWLLSQTSGHSSLHPRL